MKRLLIVILLFSILIPFISADVISLNSGGNEEMVINPNEEIEGFFSGIPSPVVAAICGNGIIETGEECDDGNTVDGDGCSSTCQTEAEGPGGGGGEPGAIITVSPTEFNVNLAVNTNIDRTITITNIGDATTTISVTQNNLDTSVILPVTELTLSPGEVREITVTFVGTSKTGIFTGTINIGGISISVSLNVKSKLLLFDSNIVVLNENYLVEQGDRLKTQVTLIPLGDKERMDVTLNYVIKDYQGEIYLTRSETLLIDERMEFKRNFATGSLPVQKYIVGLELVYPNGVAPSSAHFEVIEKIKPSFFGRLVFWLILLIILVLIILILILIKRERDKKKGKQSSS